MTDGPGPARSTTIEYRERLRWLGRLRWLAMAGAIFGTLVAIGMDWEFVRPDGVIMAVVLVTLVNLLLLFRNRTQADVGPSELWLHAVTDLLALTWMLAFAGGLTNPMWVLFSFHVVLGALLTGRSGALVALSATLVGIGALWALEREGWLPAGPLHEVPPVLSLVAIATLVSGLSYFALVLSERLRTEQLLARQAQGRAEESLVLLTESLDELKVGLEVFDDEGALRIQSPFAGRLREHFRGREPLERQSEFAFSDEEEGERLFDVITVAPETDSHVRAVLYVDRTEARLVQQRHFMLERLATLGRALQGVAHELNTPLTTMQTLAKDLSVALADVDMDSETRADLEESVGILIDESRRCRTLTQSLLSTAHEGARGETGQTLFEVARRAVRLVGLKVDHDADGRASDVRLDRPSLEQPLPADADRVLQVLMNLVQNAVKATEETEPGEGPRVEISAEPRGPDGHLRILIQDRGPGLPEEVRRRLFEPFVTTRPMGEGTGLGLYTSHRIAHELGGDLRMYDRPGGGTVAVLDLPPP